MANAKKCDRCGEYYQEREMNAIESLVNSFSPITATTSKTDVIEELIDLCPKCSKSLRKWMGGKEEPEDGK